MDAMFAFKRKKKKKQRLEDGTAVPAPAHTPIQPPKKREPAPAIPTVRENYLLAEIERLKLLILSKTPERLVVVNQHGTAITIDMTADAKNQHQNQQQPTQKKQKHQPTRQNKQQPTRQNQQSTQNKQPRTKTSSNR